MSISLGLRALLSLPLALVFSAVLYPTVCTAQILGPAAGEILFETQVSTLSPPTSCASSGVTCISGFSPVGQSVSFSGDGSGTLSSSNQYGTDPSVSSSFTFSGTFDPDIVDIEESEVSYQFAVAGPANQTVQVTVASTSSGSRNQAPGSGTSLTAQGILEVEDSSNNLLASGATCVGPPIGNLCKTKDGFGTINNVDLDSDSFDVDQNLELTTDTVYNVLIFTELEFSSTNSVPVALPDLSASVSVDPTITLDTTNPAFSLQFSPSATPEPNFLLLTVPCTSIGILLILQRRQRDLEAGCR